MHAGAQLPPMQKIDNHDQSTNAELIETAEARSNSRTGKDDGKSIETRTTEKR